MAQLSGGEQQLLPAMKTAYGDQPPGWTVSAEFVKQGGVKQDKSLQTWEKKKMFLLSSQPAKIKLNPFLIDKEMRSRWIHPGSAVTTGFLKFQRRTLSTQFNTSYWHFLLLTLTFWFLSVFLDLEAFPGRGLSPSGRQVPSTCWALFF